MADHLGGVCCGRSCFEGPYVMKTNHSIPPRTLTTTLFLLTLLLHPLAFSQHSVTNQIVTLQVVELNALSVTSRLVSFVSSMMGSEAPSASTRLVWTSNGEDRKITVACRAAHKEQPLRIAVKSSDYQVAGNDLELTDSTTLDLVNGLSKSAGGCVIQFSMGAPDESRGKGFHALIYTITGG